MIKNMVLQLGVSAFPTAKITTYISVSTSLHKSLSRQKYQKKQLFSQKQPPEMFCEKKVFLKILRSSQLH